MTMHIEGPWLSTTGRSKKKPKYRNAEAAQRAKANSDSWNALKERWGATDTDNKRKQALKAPTMRSYALNPPPGRESSRIIPSVDTGVGIASKPADKVYTGTAMLGVATMHKSNSVPVFTQEDAVEISRMRRG